MAKFGNFVAGVFSQSIDAIRNALTAGDPGAGDVNLHSGRFFEHGVRLAQDTIDGLILSNNALDADHDIDVGSGFAMLKDGSGNRRIFENPTTLVKRIDLNWGEGSDNGGFPSALTLTADTHYNFFVIGKDDGTVDAGFDTDASATNLLADASAYSWFRRILSVFTDGSSNILAFTQNGDTVYWNSTQADLVNDTTGTFTTFETVSLSCPPLQKAILNARFEASGSTSISGFIAGAEGNTGTGVEDRVGGVVASGNGANALAWEGPVVVLADASRQIQYTMNGSGSWSRVDIGTVGWIDDRRRNS